MPARPTHRIATTVACALALALGLALAPAANAASVTVANFDPLAFVTVAMNNPGVTTLTLSRDPNGARRVHEDGAALTFSDPTGFGGCAMDGLDVVCSANVQFNWTVNNTAGSLTAPVRDVVIAKSATHGDATGFFDDPLTIMTSTLMEAWLPDGTAAPKFTGSDVVTGTADQPADIVHAGSAGLAAGSAMGAGSDLVVGSTGAVNVTGGTGNDTLIGSTAADVLDGGNDSDVIRGGLGHDTLTGGQGFADVLSYDDAARTAPLAATFTPGFSGTFGTFEDAGGDTVNGGFEVLEGTPLADTLIAAPTGASLRGAEGNDGLTGGDGADTLDGGAGDDFLVGGAGIDTFAAGDGTDVVRAADGAAESVDCGPGLDVDFSADAFDALTGCEGPPAPAPAPAAAAATASTGATANAGASARPKVAAIASTLSAAFTLSGSSTVVKKLTAKALPARSTVAVSCSAPKAKKRACAFKASSKTFTKATASSAFSSLFKKRRLPAKTVIVVRITAPGLTGRQWRFTTRKKAQPKQVAGCLAPGSSRSASC